MSSSRDPDIDDIDLVEAALQGSQDAYREIVERYQRPVFGLIRRMVRDQGTAEDLAQEVFVKAFRALASFDRSRKFSSWLFKIAHNTGIDQLRKRQLDTVALETTDSEEPNLSAVLADTKVESPETRVHRGDIADALEAALSTLRIEYREVVLLRFQEGLAYEEIAQVTELPLGTVKTHLFRARKAMARHLKEQGWGPEKDP